jgi:hypothetical protein
MKKSVLLDIIRVLGKKEIREINKWLVSPAHNQRQDVVKLFDCLIENLTKDDVSLEKENVWKSIFPKEPYDDARMRQSMYFLLQSLEEYLAFSEMIKNPVHTQTVLLEVYRRKNLEKPFKMTMEAARKHQKNSQFNDLDYLKTQHTLEKEQYLHLVGQDWNMELNLQQTSNSLDVSYITDKLRLSSRMFAHQSIYKKITYDFGILSSVLEFVEKNDLLKIPAIAVYYFGYKARTNPENEDNYNNLENLILNHRQIFPDDELRELFLISINYCIIRMNAGIESYIARSFNLYKIGFEKGILIENGIIGKMSFGNAVSSALKNKDYDWAINFVEQFQNNVEEKHRKSMVHFNLSRIHFEKGDYNKAQRLLTQFEYDDILLNIIAKTMLLKIYYEQDELDAFESLLESMRTYLQRKEALDTNRKTSYKNMISIMKKLLNLNPYSKAQVEKMRELIINTNPLAERDWLLKQLNKR